MTRPRADVIGGLGCSRCARVPARVHDPLIDFPYMFKMSMQLEHEPLGGMIPRSAGHTPGQRIQSFGIFRKRVRLQVVLELKTMFQMAEELGKEVRAELMGRYEFHLAVQKIIRDEKPAKVIGKGSVSAMQSGIFWGYVGLIDSLIKRIRAEYGELLGRAAE